MVMVISGSWRGAVVPLQGIDPILKGTVVVAGSIPDRLVSHVLRWVCVSKDPCGMSSFSSKGTGVTLIY